MEQDQKQKALLRIEQLIALAERSTTPDGEARNAAMAVVRLIRQHGFKVVDPQARVVDPFETLFGKTDVRQAADNFRQNKASSRYEPPKPSPQASPKKRCGDEGRFIRSKYAGWCRYPQCGMAYDIGERIFWVANVGSWHAACAEKEFDLL